MSARAPRCTCDTDRPPRGAGPCQAACMNHLIKYAESKDRSTYFMEIVIPIPLKSNGRRESVCFEFDFSGIGISRNSQKTTVLE